MNTSSSSSNFAANNAALMAYATTVLEDSGLKEKEKVSKLWELISTHIGTSVSVGKSLGEKVGTTYASGIINTIVDVVYQHMFPKQNRSWMDSAKNLLGWGASAVTKVAVTPYAAPALTAVTGLTGSVALPLAISLIGVVYAKLAGSNPRLKDIPFEELVQIDPMGNYRDALGRKIPDAVAKSVFEVAAEYIMIANLIDQYKRIEKVYEEGEKTVNIQIIAQEIFQDYFKDFIIKRSDGREIFANGEFVTTKDKEIIQDGIDMLASNEQIVTGDKKIRDLIRLVSLKSVLPVGRLGMHRDDDSPKSVPPLFKDADAWKNYIVRAADGEYFLSQTGGGKSRGEIIPEEAMREIFNELKELPAQRMQERIEEWRNLMKARKYDEVAKNLNQLKAEQIRSFLAEYLIQRQDKYDNGKEKIVYLNGKILTEKESEDLRNKLVNITAEEGTSERAKYIEDLVKELGSKVPQGVSSPNVIRCEDGQYVSRDGKLLSVEEAVSDDFNLVEKISDSTANPIVSPEEQELEKKLEGHLERPVTEPEDLGVRERLGKVGLTDEKEKTREKIKEPPVVDEELQRRFEQLSKPEHPDISKAEGLPTREKIEKEKRIEPPVVDEELQRRFEQLSKPEHPDISKTKSPSTREKKEKEKGKPETG